MKSADYEQVSTAESNAVVYFQSRESPSPVEAQLYRHHRTCLDLSWTVAPSFPRAFSNAFALAFPTKYSPRRYRYSDDMLASGTLSLLDDNLSTLFRSSDSVLVDYPNNLLDHGHALEDSPYFKHSDTFSQHLFL